MTKRPRWTADEVAQNLHDDDDFDDPDEPLMEGSDDEFSDLDLDSDDDDTMDVDDPLFDADPALGTHSSSGTHHHHPVAPHHRHPQLHQL